MLRSKPKWWIPELRFVVIHPLEDRSQRTRKISRRCGKTMLGQASAWNRFWRDFLEVLGGSEANFLEVCFGRILYGNFHTNATSKKSAPPFPEASHPNSPWTFEKSLQSFSSHEAGWKCERQLCANSEPLLRKRAINNVQTSYIFRISELQTYPHFHPQPLVGPPLRYLCQNPTFSQKTAGNRRLHSVTLGPSPWARP